MTKESVGMKKSLTKHEEVIKELSFDMHFSLKAINAITPVR